MLSHIKDNNHSIIFTTNHNDNHTVGVNIKTFDEQSNSYSVDIDNITEENDDLNDTITSVTQVWVDNCSSPLNNIQFNNSRVLGGLLPLGIICLVVIIGNMMVMYAVKMTKKLRGATYLFIVSLGKLYVYKLQNNLYNLIIIGESLIYNINFYLYFSLGRPHARFGSATLQCCV